MKKSLVVLLKIGVSVAIIAYLVFDATRDPELFANLRDQPKQWGLFVAACFLCGGAIMLTLVRWHYLVRALEVPTRLGGSLRIGLMGYLFNLSPMGIAGGDFVKAVMLARYHKNCMAKSVASVLVDRLIGLYTLFVVASAAIVLTGFRASQNETIRVICDVTIWVTVAVAVVIGLLMVPAVTDGKLARSLERIPRVGPVLDSLIDAMRMYRRSPLVLVVAAVMSVGVHSLFATGVYCIARGLPGNVHSLAHHFVIMPLSASTGTLPLPFGPFEAVLEYLYTHVPLAVGTVAKGQGLVVALGYRLITVLIAMIGACYYIAARREVAQVIHDAERQPGIGQGPTTVMSTRRPAARVARDDAVAGVGRLQ
ncbi:MAG: lysylphosphatidylglycerol synthase transmembrane domain-containing protein [Planctomycetia bacterium]|nr:lysylphosphatidylglycerol synthase transmembrane domain-containing protein [Planctomycetia bacterium]